MTLSREWWREAAWMSFPDGTHWIHPQTRIEALGVGHVRLHAHKLRDNFVTLTAASPLGQAALNSKDRRT